MKILNNSDAAIIVVHEIYGINQHIKEVCQGLSKLGYDIFCPDLLKVKQPFNYSQEKQAYNYFMDNIGFTTASQQIKDLITKIRKKYKVIYLLGFSVGATIAWLCSDEDVKVDGVIGFYGSRIRDYLRVVPKCPTLLIFGNQEKSFDVGEILPEMQRKEKVEVHILLGKHGFADQYANNYCEQSYLKARDIVTSLLKNNK